MSRSPDSVLPYGRQLVEEDDIAAVVNVLKGNFLTTGPTVADFERAFAEQVGARYALACSSGTAALHLAAMALGLEPGSAVVVPTMTFLATANAARYVGAEVVFADVDPDTGLMTGETLEAALARADEANLAVKAVFPVHLNGQSADMREIGVIAAKRKLDLVEDCCHLLGGKYLDDDAEGSSVGSCPRGGMSVFSLHPVKVITMGEGGVVTTNDEVFRDSVLRQRNHGMVRDRANFQSPELGLDSTGAPNPWYYEMPEPGFNYRASDIHCALGLSQIAKLSRFNTRRDEIVARYDRLLAPLAPTVRPVRRVPWCQPAWHLYAVHIDFEAAGSERSVFMRRLRKMGVGTQVHYIPVHLQPYYRNRYGDLTLPGAEAYYAHALSLPLFPAMRDGDVDMVVRAVKTLCAT